MEKNDFKLNVNTLLTGPAIGITQTIVGHPLDTLKTLKQNNINICLARNNFSFKRMYYGLKYPLALNIGYNTILFNIYDIGKEKTNNHFISGAFAGGMTSVIVNPFDIYKINKQIGNINNSSYKIYKGLPITVVREVLAAGIYFSSYNLMKNEYNMPTFISGGLGGSLSWLITYPIDTVKTQYQASNCNLNTLEFIKKMAKNKDNCLYNRNSKLWNGLGLCLARGFIVNSVSFVVYEMFHQ